MFKIIFLIILLMGGASTVMLSGKEDSAAEEFIEDVIEDQTGMDIDFTPGSKEK